MESGRLHDIEILRLCPTDENSLNDLADDLIELLKIPPKMIQHSDREIARAKVKLGRWMINLGNCFGINQLAGISFIESLYQHNQFECKNEIALELQDCINLGKQIIISSINTELKNLLLKQILKNIIVYDLSTEGSSFLCYLWQMRDQIPLTIDTVEELINIFPLCIELFLLDVVENVALESQMNDDLNDNVFSLCKLCSVSSKLFKVVLTILHELLLLSNFDKQLQNFIYSFVHRVEQNCKNNSFVELFPEKIQVIITYLQIKPSLYPESFFDNNFTISNVLKKLSNFMDRNPRVGIALLTYYPEWLSHLSNYHLQAIVTEIDASESLSDKYLKILFDAFK